MRSQIAPILGVRGGLPISALGGKVVEGAMSPAAARGFKEPLMPSKSSRRSKRDSGYASSELDEDSTIGDSWSQIVHAIPEGRKKWGNVPGRNFMREKAALSRFERGFVSRFWHWLGCWLRCRFGRRLRCRLRRRFGRGLRSWIRRRLGGRLWS